MKPNLNDAVFTPSKDKAKKREEGVKQTGTIYYVPYFNTDVHDLNGNGIGTESAGLAAQTTSINALPKYFIRISDRNELFDFTDPTHVGTINKVVNGVPVWSMRVVTKDQFDNYLAFMRTSNKTFLGQARQVY